MCMFIANASKPNPSLGVGTSLDEPVGDFNLALVDLVLAGLDIDRHKLVRLRVHVDIRSHALLEYLVAAQQVVKASVTKVSRPAQQAKNYR